MSRKAAKTQIEMTENETSKIAVDIDYDLHTSLGPGLLDRHIWNCVHTNCVNAV